MNFANGMLMGKILIATPATVPTRIDSEDEGSITLTEGSTSQSKWLPEQSRKQNSSALKVFDSIFLYIRTDQG